MKLIGTGAFTKAYLQDNGKVLLKSVCPIKECMALGWFPDSYLFPEVKMIDTHLYEMEYLERVRTPKRQLNSYAYSLYRKLIECSDAFHDSNVSTKYDGYSHLYKVFETLLAGFTEKETILEALDGCSNAGSDIGFEISPRNISVDNQGNLIMQDCFFNQSKLEEVRK